MAAGRHPHLAAVMQQAATQAPGRGSENADPEKLFERVVLGAMSGLLGVVEPVVAEGAE
jgi:hypothetical protein